MYLIFWQFVQNSKYSASSSSFITTLAQHTEHDTQTYNHTITKTTND